MEVPVTESATLQLRDRTVDNVFPFWPAGARVCGTPEAGITRRLVYCGSARLDEIHPAILKDQIAVLDADSGQNWTLAAAMGAQAIIVLGGDSVTNFDLRSHELAVPINIPRFYLPAGKTADALRAGRVTEPAVLKSRVSWRRIIARNYYALVMPASTAKDVPRSGAMAITAGFDSSSLVPDLAPGAGQAVQAAAALSLLRDVAQHPLKRPVLFCFTGGDSVAFQASRNLLMALGEPPQPWQKEAAQVSTDLADARVQLDRAVFLQNQPGKLDLTLDRALIDRLVKLTENESVAVQESLFAARMNPPAGESEDNRGNRGDLEKRQATLNALAWALRQQPAQLAGDRLGPDARAIIQQAIKILRGSASTATRAREPGLVEELDQRVQQLHQRADLFSWLAKAEGRSGKLIELMVGLDLVGHRNHTNQLVPVCFGRFASSSASADIQDYADWMIGIERAFRGGDAKAKWFGEISRAFDFESLGSSFSSATWAPAAQAIPTEMAQAWGIPAFSFLTADELHATRDTPNDLPASVDLPAVVSQLQAVQVLLTRAWNDPKFKSAGEPKLRRTSLSGQVVGAAAGRPLADLPAGHFLVTYANVTRDDLKIPSLKSMPYAVGVRRCEMQPTDADGNYRIEGLWKLVLDQQDVGVTAYKPAAGSGEISSCTDLASQAGGLTIYANFRDREVDPQRLQIFNCDEFKLAGLYDPRYMQDLTDLLPLDARRNTAPPKYNFVLQNQLLAGFVEQGARQNLLMRYGRIGNRLILVNMPGGLNDARDFKSEISNQTAAHMAREKTSPEAGRGFSVEELNHLDPLPLVTARDLWRLDDLRLAKYASAGVTSKMLDDLHRAAGQQLENAQRLALSPGADAQALITQANAAWASEARVYSAAQDMADDVVHAALFLLLICVPFAFCMERLLIGTANVYRQIAGTAGIFAVMTTALWCFHPAFKISSSPLIIIMAFAIIFMSVAVIAVIYGRFDAELKRARGGSGGRGNAQGASFARASVLMNAVVLGIANMRRRPFRTVLTSVTIVLITFVVLCFTGSSRYLDTTTIPTGIASQYSGVMLRQRGFRPLNSATAMQVRAAVNETLAGIEPAGDPAAIVEHWWNVDPFDPLDQIHLSAGSRGIALPGIVGISPGESRQSAIAEVIGGEKFDRLERDPAAKVAYLSDAVAEQLKVREGEKVSIGGIELEIAGVFSADDFDRKVTTLSGEPIGPLRYVRDAVDTSGRKLQENGADEVSLDADAGAAELAGGYEHLNSTQFAIVPAWVSKRLPNARLVTLGVRVADDPQTGAERVRKISDDLSRRFSIALFAGQAEGVQMVVASSLTSVSGAGEVAIPLLIAGLIIFNTMMGSIAERRREIHIYTSLGLAPLHVGALFIAEAMTYGLIGVVFGYVIGQGVGTVLLKLGWLGDVTLNYSGSSAMLTMGMILLIVLLSALVPARMASKLAAPSIERSWKVPLPLGNEISVVLPFTINQTAAEGVLAYLVEFFEAHQEGSIGKFSTGMVEVFGGTTSSREDERGLQTTVWLSPFDLGIQQSVTLRVQPGVDAEIFEVHVQLTRLSGSDQNWHRQNRTFLTELRQQFLQWRSLSPGRMMEYVELSRQKLNPAH